MYRSSPTWALKQPPPPHARKPAPSVQNAHKHQISIGEYVWKNARERGVGRNNNNNNNNKRHFPHLEECVTKMFGLKCKFHLREIWRFIEISDEIWSFGATEYAGTKITAIFQSNHPAFVSSDLQELFRWFGRKTRTFGPQRLPHPLNCWPKNADNQTPHGFVRQTPACWGIAGKGWQWVRYMCIIFNIH